ncbi:gliding motility-associated C-terminal domain-containing protein, partial [Saprospiraceae bacterium]|nr:gliding motility-associated C-terminal domain-containing protein [Saprospiraceae bacterium]
NLSDSIVVSFVTSPVPFDLGNDDTICFGESILLEGFQGDSVLYTWQNNESTAEFTVTETGLYSLETSTFCGTETDEIHILVLDNVDIENPLESNYVSCEGEPLLVDLSSLIESQIEWFDQSNDPIREFLYPGSYHVQFSNICNDTIFSFLFEHENCVEDNIYVANSFTPNGDGINDFFNIYLAENWEVQKFHISIYSRWGEQIYESDDINFQWSGKRRGYHLNPGVFAYYFEIDILVDGEKKTIQKSGDITIIK